MGNTRHLGITTTPSREEQHRKAEEEQNRDSVSMMMNKWGFRSACLKRSRSYNDGEPDMEFADGLEVTDGREPEVDEGNGNAGCRHGDEA